MTQGEKQVAVSEKQFRGIATSIADRLSQELIFAFVGPVGSGVSTTATLFAEILAQRFQYQVAPTIKMSDIIRNEAHRVGLSVPPKNNLTVYIDAMQTAGNKLRERYDPDYLAKKAIEKIVAFKEGHGGFAENRQPLPGRRAHIIDSLKNMEELVLLKQVYGETLCVIGVFAPDEIREQRLIDSGADKKQVDIVVSRDQSDLPTFGQMTRKLFVEADLFIRNDRKEEELRTCVGRYLDLIFDTRVHTPTKAESAMYEANAVAASSACMSRQVGAAIVSAKGELISTGWNDVPKFGGGLYREDDQSVFNQKANRVEDRDNRCFKWGGNICHNETRRNKILDDIAKAIAGSSVVQATKTEADVRKLLDGTDVDLLTEFSRAIHAEMEAILSVAREGRHSLVGATLYSTTYPCHSCARHIVAAGISTVIYIQPYRKSLATTLHADAVTELPDKDGAVAFRQYDGVAPRNFLRLFLPTAERKESGRLASRNPQTALPGLRIPLDGPWDYESKIIADLMDKEQNLMDKEQN